MNTDQLTEHINSVLDKREQFNAYGVSLAPYHTHNKTDSPQVNVFDLANFPSPKDNSGKYLSTDGSSLSFQTITIPQKFGGTGVDGILAVSSGTTTINLGGAAIVIKNYSSIAITGTGQVAFSNPNATGTLVIFRCQDDCEISSSNIALSLKGFGGSGGAGASGDITIAGTITSGNGTENSDYGLTPVFTGKFGLGSTTTNTLQNGGGGGSLVTAGVAGSLGGSGTGTHGQAGTPLSGITAFLLQSQYYNKNLLLMSGAGGGGGINATGHGVTSTFGSNGSGGTSTSPDGGTGTAGSGTAVVVAAGAAGGGAGGGAFYLEVNGSLNFTGQIDCTGGKGGNGQACSGGTSSNWAGSGGGGGSGGTCVILYNAQTAISGTIGYIGGTGGTAGTATGTGATNGGDGGHGGDGFRLLAQNIYFV